MATENDGQRIAVLEQRANGVHDALVEIKEDIETMNKLINKLSARDAHNQAQIEAIKTYLQGLKANIATLTETVNSLRSAIDKESGFSVGIKMAIGYAAAIVAWIISNKFIKF